MESCKRNTSARGFLIAAVSVIATFGIAPHAAAQPCTDASVAQLPGKWTESRPDLVLAREAAPPNLHQTILKRIEPIAAMFREAYPEPRGTMAGGQASIRRVGDEVKGGAVQYGYTSSYNTWLCPTTTRRAVIAGETGNWAYVYVNSLHHMLSESAEMQIDGRPTRVWKLSRRIGELRGEPLYETRMGLGYGRGLLLARAGRFPWKPISQKQYLDALALFFEKQAAETNNAIDDTFRDIEKAIEDVRKNQDLKKEMRDQIVAQMQQELARARARRPVNNKNLARGVAEEIKYIRDYQARHSEKEMAQPAILPGGMSLTFRGQFGTETEGGHYLVVVDPGYFRKDLPQEAAQIVTLLWRWEGDSAASAAWRTTFERRFPIDHLRALIDR
jgi:hypothetical protein